MLAMINLVNEYHTPPKSMAYTFLSLKSKSVEAAGTRATGVEGVREMPSAAEDMEPETFAVEMVGLGVVEAADPALDPDGLFFLIGGNFFFFGGGEGSFSLVVLGALSSTTIESLETMRLYLGFNNDNSPFQG